MQERECNCERGWQDQLSITLANSLGWECNCEEKKAFAGPEFSVESSKASEGWCSGRTGARHSGQAIFRRKFPKQYAQMKWTMHWKYYRG